MVSLILHVRHQANSDATVLLATGRRLVGRDFLILTDTNEIELMWSNVVLGLQIIYDGIRTPLAEVVVVLRIAGGVSASGDLKDVVAGAV